MNETVREMTFEEEYAILQKETDRLFEKEESIAVYQKTFRKNGIIT